MTYERHTAPPVTRPERVWVFDSNHRCYPVTNGGRSIGETPIWRKHWRPVEIVGETRRSWVGASGQKFAKRRPEGHRMRAYCLSEAEIDSECWAHEHRYKLSRIVESLDAATLRAVAEAIGYEPLA